MLMLCLDIFKTIIEFEKSKTTTQISYIKNKKNVLDYDETNCR